MIETTSVSGDTHAFSASAAAPNPCGFIASTRMSAGSGAGLRAISFWIGRFDHILARRRLDHRQPADASRAKILDPAARHGRAHAPGADENGVLQPRTRTFGGMRRGHATHASPCVSKTPPRRLLQRDLPAHTTKLNAGRNWSAASSAAARIAATSPGSGAMRSSIGMV